MTSMIIERILVLRPLITPVINDFNTTIAAFFVPTTEDRDIILRPLLALKPMTQPAIKMTWTASCMCSSQRSRLKPTSDMIQWAICPHAPQKPPKTLAQVAATCARELNLLTANNLATNFSRSSPCCHSLRNSLLLRNRSNPSASNFAASGLSHSKSCRSVLRGFCISSTFLFRDSNFAAITSIGFLGSTTLSRNRLAMSWWLISGISRHDLSTSSNNAWASCQLMSGPASSASRSNEVVTALSTVSRSTLVLSLRRGSETIALSWTWMKSSKNWPQLFAGSPSPVLHWRSNDAKDVCSSPSSSSPASSTSRLSGNSCLLAILKCRRNHWTHRKIQMLDQKMPKKTEWNSAPKGMRDSTAATLGQVGPPRSLRDWKKNTHAVCEQRPREDLHFHCPPIRIKYS
mmetsp:Transcript_64693/g.171262  ORF Transcript_64693/g.171262 Transcript_64693/m.171262 type:complete len:403 (+) Transcript_64693:135-1343(+)